MDGPEVKRFIVYLSIYSHFIHIFYFKRAKKDGLGVEVIVIKFKYHGRSIIVPLKLGHYEYDEIHRVKNTQAISNMIYSAIEEYNMEEDL